MGKNVSWFAARLLSFWYVCKHEQMTSVELSMIHDGFLKSLSSTYLWLETYFIPICTNHSLFLMFHCLIFECLKSEQLWYHNTARKRIHWILNGQNSYNIIVLSWKSALDKKNGYNMTISKFMAVIDVAHIRRFLTDHLNDSFQLTYWCKNGDLKPALQHITTKRMQQPWFVCGEFEVNWWDMKE